MTGSEILLAALAAGGEGASFSVLQIQKLLFLIDREASDLVGERHFRFSAGALDPCDDRILDELVALIRSGEIVADRRPSGLSLPLTTKSFQCGIQVLQGLSVEAMQAFTDRTRWVRSVSVAGLLATIFGRYPETAVNSKVRVQRRYPRPLDLCSKRPFLRGMARAFDFAGTLRRDFTMWTDPKYEAAGLASDWEAVGESFRAVLPMADSEPTES